MQECGASCVVVLCTWNRPKLYPESWREDVFPSVGKPFLAAQYFVRVSGTQWPFRLGIKVS